MEDFNEKLITHLKKESKFMDNEGNILRSKIIDAALKVDKALISLLLSDKTIKEKFRIKRIVSAFKCLRCEHKWIPRTDNFPEVCPNPKCKSPYWNNPLNKNNRGK